MTGISQGGGCCHREQAVLRRSPAASSSSRVQGHSPSTSPKRLTKSQMASRAPPLRGPRPGGNASPRRSSGGGKGGRVGSEGAPVIPSVPEPYLQGASHAQWRLARPQWQPASARRLVSIKGALLMSSMSEPHLQRLDAPSYCYACHPTFTPILLWQQGPTGKQ